MSASKEKRRRRTNFLGAERASPVSPEKKSCDKAMAGSPGCPLQLGFSGRGGGLQEEEGGKVGGRAATFKKKGK